MSTKKKRKKVAKKKVAKKKVAKKKVAKKKVAKKKTLGAKVSVATFSGDGNILATATGKRVTFWNVSGAPKKLKTIKTQVDASRIALDRDGARLAAAVAGFSEVRIRSTSGVGTMLHEIRARGAVTCFAFAQDGRFFVGEAERIGEGGLHARSFISVYDPQNGSELFRSQLLDLPIRDIHVSHDGLLLFLGFGGGVVMVYDLDARRELFRFPNIDLEKDRATIGSRIAAAFAFSADARRAAICFEDTVEVWAVDTGERISSFNLGARCWSVAFGPDGKSIVCGAPAAGVWAVDGRKLGPLDVAHAVVASRDGRHVLLGERIGARGPRLAGK